MDDVTRTNRVDHSVALLAFVRAATVLMAVISALTASSVGFTAQTVILQLGPLLVITTVLAIGAASGRIRHDVRAATTTLDLGCFVAVTAVSEGPGTAGWIGLLALVEGPMHFGRKGALLTATPMALALWIWPGEQGSPAGSLMLIVLISAAATVVSEVVRSARQQTLAIQEQFESAFRFAGVPIALARWNGTLVDANPALVELLDRSAEQIVGTRLLDLCSGESAVRLEQALQDLSPEHGVRIEITIAVASPRRVVLSVGALTRAASNTPDLVVHFDDVTEQREAELRLAKRAEHDALTGLRNRLALVTALEHELQHEPTCAVLFIDLDGFKAVNDRLGHEAGDHLLVEVASRLAGEVRPNDVIGRFGGDEFAVIVRGTDALGSARVAARRVLATLERPIVFCGNSMTVGASIGLAPGLRGDTADFVLKSADLAMYAAKAAGGAEVVVYEPWMRTNEVERRGLAGELRDAVEAGHIEVVYQPTIRVTDGAMVGVEALARWTNAAGRSVPPDEFVRVAEQSGLIIPLGTAVLDRALARISHLKDCPDLTLAVNVSPLQLVSPGFADTIDAKLREHGLPPQRLRVELTETAKLEDEEAVIANLLGLRRLGVQVALDDFGTGHATLSYLARLPVDVVKVDRLFVRGLGTAPEAVPIIRGVVAMAHALGLQVVAEGVETHEQLAWVQELGCDEVQGFLLGRPMPAEHLATAMDVLASHDFFPLAEAEPVAPETKGQDSAEGRYRLLLDAARDVTSAQTLDEILHRSLKALRGLLEFTGGSIQLVGPDGRIRLAAADPPPTSQALEASIAVGQGIGGIIVAGAQPAYLGDITADARVPQGRRVGSASAEVRSYYGVPLVSHGRAIGVLQVDSVSAHAFDTEDRAALLAFAPIVAAAVADANQDGRRNVTGQHPITRAVPRARVAPDSNTPALRG